MFVFFLILIFSQYSAKSQDTGGSNYGDGSSTVPPSPTACNNCTICQYPCHPQPPPAPPSGYPAYAAPPPPPVGQVNCPPPTPAACCGNQYYVPPPPSPFYYPYNNFSGAEAPPLWVSALIKPGSYGSTWPPAVFLCFILLFICG